LVGINFSGGLLMAETAKEIVVDPGLDETIKKLTPKKIENTINKVLTRGAAARLKVYMQTCVHCGLCAEACHFYLSHDKDPRFSPVGKVKQTLWEDSKEKGQGGWRVY